jgi:hypothetical protein
MSRLNGKVVVIADGSNGIGLVAANAGVTPLGHIGRPDAQCRPNRGKGATDGMVRLN